MFFSYLLVVFQNVFRFEFSAGTCTAAAGKSAFEEPAHHVPEAWYENSASKRGGTQEGDDDQVPFQLILMELAQELSANNCELQLQWIRRDLNQPADERRE